MLNPAKIKENATQELRQQKGVENVKKYQDFIQTDTGKELKENVESIVKTVKDKTVDVAFKQEYGIKTFIKGHKVIRKV